MQKKKTPTNQHEATDRSESEGRVHSPSMGTSRKSLLEMSTTVQRSRDRTSTWARPSRLSRCVWVEELQTSTVCCTAGPVRAGEERETRVTAGRVPFCLDQAAPLVK